MPADGTKSLHASAGAMLLTCVACMTDMRPAELAITNARIHTMHDAQPLAQAVGIREGSIVYVGDDAGARAYIGDETRVIDAGGRVVLPGFIDAHVHPLSGYGLYLAEDTTAESVYDAVAAYAASHPDEEWVEGYGWDLNLFLPQGPRREVLDSLVPDRPAMIWGGDGHSLWVNSRALEAARIDDDTPDPPGGRIERGPDGSPSGTLREAAATMVEDAAPKWSLERRLSALERSLGEMRRFGITGFLDAAVDDQAMLDVYREASRRGILTAHASLSLALPRESEELDVAQTVARFEAMRATVAADDIDAGTVKIFVDGVIEAGTAAMLEPYTGAGGDRGELLRAPGVLDSLTRALHEAGFQLHYHAIGDRAARAVLNAASAAGMQAGDSLGGRPLLAHVQIVDPVDVPRFVELGAIPVFQALWAYADKYITDLTIPRLGPERSHAIYPIRTLQDAGARIALGSDWPVTSMDPLRAIEVAVTRTDPDLPAGKGEPFLPAERIDLAAAVRAYTLGSAYATRREHEAGSIEIGKRADLIVLSDDLFALDPRRIGDVRVLLTLYGGREVYRDSVFR